jgi:DNA-binding response OmpR family regulator
MPQTSRILIADDEETFLRSTADLLRREGYNVDCVPGAEAGVDRLRAEKYDLLISDIKMPGNPHLHFIELLPDIAPGMPAILVTGFPSQASAIQAIHLPVVAYMVKPVDFDELLANVRTAIGRSRLRSIVAASERRLRYWLQSLDDIQHASALKTPRQSSDLTKNFYDLTFENVSAILSDLRKASDFLDSHRLQSLDCPLNSCPRMEELASALAETVEILEKTRNAFKSKELGLLRKKLEQVLAKSQKTL